jgi:hypothetical protein
MDIDQKVSKESLMTSLSPKLVYNNLKLLDRSDIATSAIYRQQAQEILGDTAISLRWRQAIAQRLHLANHWLTLLTANEDDSY